MTRVHIGEWGPFTSQAGTIPAKQWIPLIVLPLIMSLNTIYKHLFLMNHPSQGLWLLSFCSDLILAPCNVLGVFLQSYPNCFLLLSLSGTLPHKTAHLPSPELQTCLDSRPWQQLAHPRPVGSAALCLGHRPVMLVHMITASGEFKSLSYILIVSTIITNISNLFSNLYL